MYATAVALTLTDFPSSCEILLQMLVRPFVRDVGDRYDGCLGNGATVARSPRLKDLAIFRGEEWLCLRTGPTVCPSLNYALELALKLRKFTRKVCQVS